MLPALDKQRNCSKSRRECPSLSEERNCILGHSREKGFSCSLSSLAMPLCPRQHFACLHAHFYVRSAHLQSCSFEPHSSTQFFFFLCMFTLRPSHLYLSYNSEGSSPLPELATGQFQAPSATLCSKAHCCVKCHKKAGRHWCGCIGNQRQEGS